MKRAGHPRSRDVNDQKDYGTYRATDELVQRLFCCWCGHIARSAISHHRHVAGNLALGCICTVSVRNIRFYRLRSRNVRTRRIDEAASSKAGTA